VLATSASTAPSATALQAILSTTTAGLSAAAVRGHLGSAPKQLSQIGC
jgi:hypothetical protein